MCSSDLSEKAFDPALDKAARPALQTLNLPAIKARHADLYKGGDSGKPDRTDPSADDAGQQVRQRPVFQLGGELVEHRPHAGFDFGTFGVEGKLVRHVHPQRVVVGAQHRDAAVSRAAFERDAFVFHRARPHVRAAARAHGGTTCPTQQCGEQQAWAHHASRSFGR